LNSPNDASDGFLHVGGIDDGEARHGQTRLHEGSGARANAVGVVITHLHGITGDAHQCAARH
jgi:hypothetical protein